MKNLYSSDLTKAHYDAIIIGSGLGGLTTAVCMAKAGKKVLVLEKHYVLGGFTHTFKRKKWSGMWACIMWVRSALKTPPCAKPLIM